MSGRRTASYDHSLSSLFTVRKANLCQTCMPLQFKTCPWKPAEIKFGMLVMTVTFLPDRTGVGCLGTKVSFQKKRAALCDSWLLTMAHCPCHCFEIKISFCSFMAESGMDTQSYKLWQEEASGNVAADGMFSIQASSVLMAIISLQLAADVNPEIWCRC